MSNPDRDMARYRQFVLDMAGGAPLAPTMKIVAAGIWRYAFGRRLHTFADLKAYLVAGDGDDREKVARDLERAGWAA